MSRVTRLLIASVALAIGIAPVAGALGMVPAPHPPGSEPGDLMFEGFVESLERAAGGSLLQLEDFRKTGEPGGELLFTPAEASSLSANTTPLPEPATISQLVILLIFAYGIRRRRID